MESSPRAAHQEQMFALVVQWQSSGISQKAFASQHGMGLATFGYWARKYRAFQNQPVEEFVSLNPTNTSTRFELHYPNGVVLKTPSGLPLSDLSLLIRLV